MYLGAGCFFSAGNVPDVNNITAKIKSIVFIV
jgi:hypothetical protein